jgi:hypothetical protein
MNPLNGIIVILSSVLSLFGLGTGAISQVQATRQMISPPAQIQPLNPQQLCQPPMQPQFLDSPRNDPQHGYVCIQPGQSLTVRPQP